ncbi:MAG: hypothetical protein JWQ11_2740 [Rhizobacter sp.]|nr:hypothetical protein [Rhizobacter sp.]
MAVAGGIVASPAHAAESVPVDDHDARARLIAMQAEIAEQTRQLDTLRRSLAQQEARLADMRRRVQGELLAGQGGDAASPTAAVASNAGEPSTAAAAAGAPPIVPVGRAPEREANIVVVPQLFEQPGVLTPAGSISIEPSIQYSYSSSNRVALVGYTVIPSILVGVVDVREVKRSSFTGALTARWGLTNRLEVEGKLPWVYRSDTSIGRELLQGSSSSSAFDASGQGIGDVELTARYQLNVGGPDEPYYVGSLRFKSRTGKDPFQVTTSKNIVGFNDDGVQSQLPTGSGFYGLQPALTMLYPSDPAVFFGTVSYLHSFARDNVVRNTDSGEESLGRIAPGGIIGLNFGMGLALNDKSSFSIGYDHASVGRTRQNGAVAADSVRVQLGTLLLGYSYRLSPTRSLNLSLGAGLTRDTPDVTLSLRVPTTF